MIRLFFLAVFSFSFFFAGAQTEAPPRLIVRVDDMGCSHATNEGIMKSFTEGIATSVEVMAPAPWFPEAARLLRENPQYDAGLHLVLTSEWSDLKWRPLTHAPSLTDEHGYFYPVIWPNEKFGKGRALKEHDWKIEEVEAELRAQIELAKQEIPHLTHVSGHMGCDNMSEEVQTLVRQLCREYGLAIFPEDYGVERFPRFSEKEQSGEERANQFIKALEQLESGKTYLLVTHPAVNTPEQQAIGHPGYETVASDRQAVLDVLVHPAVRKAIRDKGVELISYASLTK